MYLHDVQYAVGTHEINEARKQDPASWNSLERNLLSLDNVDWSTGNLDILRQTSIYQERCKLFRLERRPDEIGRFPPLDLGRARLTRLFIE